MSKKFQHSFIRLWPVCRQAVKETLKKEKREFSFRGRDEQATRRKKDSPLSTQEKGRRDTGSTHSGRSSNRTGWKQGQGETKQDKTDATKIKHKTSGNLRSPDGTCHFWLNLKDSMNEGWFQCPRSSEFLKGQSLSHWEFSGMIVYIPSIPETTTILQAGKKKSTIKGTLNLSLNFAPFVVQVKMLLISYWLRLLHDPVPDKRKMMDVWNIREFHQEYNSRMCFQPFWPMETFNVHVGIERPVCHQHAEASKKRNQLCNISLLHLPSNRKSLFVS